MSAIAEVLRELDGINKLAEEQESQNIVGQDPGSMPGSENDKPAPSEATNPDKEVADKDVGGEKNRSIADAKPGSDAPVTQSGLYEADEPVLTPDKKPVDSEDYKAKTASDLANNMVSKILNAKKAAAQPAKAAQPAQAAQPAAPAKQAAAGKDTIQLDMEVMAKIASIALADEEGQIAIEKCLHKRAGADFTAELFGVLEKRAAEKQAQLDFEKGAQDAEAMLGDLEEAQGAADAEEALAGAAAEGGDEGAPEDAGLDDAGLEGGGDEEVPDLSQFSADQLAEAAQELAADGTITQDDADAIIEAVSESAAEEGGEDDLSEEEMADAFDQAMANGQLTEEDAQAIIQQLSDEGADGGAVEELAGDVGGGEPAAAPEPDAEKAAAARHQTSVKLASAIKRLRARK